MPILQAEKSVYPDNLLVELVETDPRRGWWAIHTKARQEKAFARQLLGMGIPFYLPLVRKENLIRGRRINSYVPVFSGYVFLFGTDEERVQGLTTNRVSNVIRVVDQLQLTNDLRQVAHLIATDAPLTVERRLAPGHRVRVRKGPMEGVEGVVVKRRGKTRLLVAVTLLQQGVSVEIDDFLLEPI